MPSKWQNKPKIKSKSDELNTSLLNCTNLKRSSVNKLHINSPELKPWDHAIKLLENAPAVLDCKVYPLAQQEQVVQDEFICEHLTKHYVQPLKLPYTTLFFFVKKKDGPLCPVQDYQQLNKWTHKNQYTLPLISELVNVASGHQWYSTMDVCWGYNNIRIKECDQWKAVFKTNRSLYELNIMFCGLTNSPATFQTMMDDLFCEEVMQGWLLTYIVDILVFTNGSREDHLKKVALILQKLLDNDLFLKPEKCHVANQCFCLCHQCNPYPT